MDNEFILQDRVQKIKQIIKKYDEDNFYISYSGGKDSNVLSALVDLALPCNQIPRVYADTGIELTSVRNFVREREDSRIVIIKPSVPIKKMLEEEGYPFKSKVHSQMVARYQSKGLENYKGVRAYTGMELTLKGTKPFRTCPKKLLYQFTDENTLKISDQCCYKLKEEPLQLWEKENNKPYGIIGIMREEGGRRTNAVCLAFIRKKLKSFQPLVAVTKEWENWFIEKYEVPLPDVYYPPYNFERTGCKGCPFARYLQRELDVLEEFFPNERKQCEAIWKPVYDEYRRIGYRLKENTNENH